MAGGDYEESVVTPSWNIMTICTVGGVLFFNAITRQLEIYAHGNKQSKELLESVYRELSVLGIVAFVIWSIQSSSYLALDYDVKHFFEVVHMTLFLAAIFHSFFVVLVSLYSKQVSKRWDVYEDDEMKRYKELKQQHRRTAQALGLRHSTLKRGVGPLRQMWMWIRHPALSRRLYQLSENVSYHAMRSHFIKMNQLPRNFRFSVYLKKCEQEVVIEMAEIKESVWVGFILAVGIELYIKGLFGEAESGDDVRILFLISAGLVLIAALGVHFKLGKIYRALLYSYTTSTDRREDFMQFLSPDANALFRQQDMFWFGQPEIMPIMLQSMQFLLATMVAVLVWFGTGHDEMTDVVVVGEIVLAVGALGIYTVVLPSFIPAFTMVTHVGEMVDRHILSETLEKQKRAFRRRTLPPTLRQVTMLARMKVEEPKAAHSLRSRARKFFAGHFFREIMIVFLSIHFFVVAYNTDAVENGYGSGDAYISQCVFAAFGVVVEILTHGISWGGEWCCFGSPFYREPTSPGGASSVYPTSKSQRLNETSAHHSQSEWNERNAYPKHRRGQSVKQCSIWACFSRERIQGGYHGCVPPEAAAGFYRALDAALVVLVAASTIATGLTTGKAKVVMHALQGAVILRLIPLHFCPLPPKPGREHMHDLDGVAMDHHPLSRKEREEVMEETLRLLRGQGEMKGLNEDGSGHGEQGGRHDHDAAAGATTATDYVADGTATASGGLPRPHESDNNSKGIEGQKDGTRALVKVSGVEEKDDQGDALRARVKQLAGGGEDADIAKVGVAIALREACTAHPEIVTMHGPLSAPILRAMLGLDPHQTGHRDNHEAFAIAAGALSLKGTPGDRNRQLSQGLQGDNGNGMGMAMGVGLSPPSSPYSSASSEFSDGSEDGRKGRVASGVRTGRLPSWLGGGRNTGDRVAASLNSSVHGPAIGRFGDVEGLMDSTDHDDLPDGVERNESYLGPLVPTTSTHSRVSAGRTIKSPTVGSSSWTVPSIISGGTGQRGLSSRHSGTSSRHSKSMGGRSSRMTSGSGLMPAAKEDMARPKLSSFATNTNATGWDSGWSPSHSDRSGGAHGAGIPTSSAHRSQSRSVSARGTPRNAARGTPSRRASNDQIETDIGARAGDGSDLGSTATALSAALTHLPSVTSSTSQNPAREGSNTSAE